MVTVPIVPDQEPYSEQRIIEFPADFDVAAAFRTDRADLPHEPAFHIIGTCPHCGDETVAVCAIDYLAAENAGLRSKHTTRLRDLVRRPAPIAGSYITVLRCACIENHAAPQKGQSSAYGHGTAESDTDAPTGSSGAGFGCGAEWLLRVTMGSAPCENDPTKSCETVQLEKVCAAKATRYWPAADAAAAEATDAPANAVASAKGWGAAFTAMLTLLGVGGLVSSRTTVQTLPTLSRLLFAVLAGLALLADAIMLYQSNTASFGSPRIRRNVLASRPLDADLDPFMEAKTSARRLRAAVLATIAAAVLAAGASAILLFVNPARPGAHSTLTLTTNGITNKTPCGTLVYPTTSSTAAKSVRFTPIVSGAKTETIPLSEITEVDAC